MSKLRYESYVFVFIFIYEVYLFIHLQSFNLLAMHCFIRVMRALLGAGRTQRNEEDSAAAAMIAILTVSSLVAVTVIFYRWASSISTKSSSRRAICFACRRYFISCVGGAELSRIIQSAYIHTSQTHPFLPPALTVVSSPLLYSIHRPSPSKRPCRLYTRSKAAERREQQDPPPDVVHVNTGVPPPQAPDAPQYVIIIREEG